MGSRRWPVCAIEDLPPGTMKLVPVGKFGVGVYNIDGSLYAIANYCAHEGAPLCAGYVGGTNEFDPETPGWLRHVRAGRIVRCPWHQWEFDITTGRTVADARKRVRIYQVDIADGEVYLVA